MNEWLVILLGICLLLSSPYVGGTFLWLFTNRKQNLRDYMSGRSGLIHGKIGVIIIITILALLIFFGIIPITIE